MNRIESSPLGLRPAPSIQTLRGVDHTHFYFLGHAHVYRKRYGWRWFSPPDLENNGKQTARTDRTPNLHHSNATELTSTTLMGMESRDAVWYPADADADGNCDGHLPPPMTRFASLLFAPLGWNRPARAGAAARGAAAIADRRARMPAVRESMVAMPAVNAVIFYCYAAGTCRRSSRRNPSEIDASTRAAARRTGR